MRNIPPDNTSYPFPFSISYTLDEIEIVAHEILRKFPGPRIFLLRGPMGAGKTTLVATIVKLLGIEILVSSPTYSFIQDYSINTKKIFHMDLFRAKTPEEIFDFGFWEMVEDGNYLFIEWPEKIIRFLDIPFLSIQLEIINFNKRTLLIKENE